MQIVVSPAFSLSPSKLAFFSKFDRTYSSPVVPCVFKKQSYFGANVNRFHGFEISPNAFRSLRQKINWLYTLARKRDVTTVNGRRIFSYRMGFFTFTLPSAQKTCTADITSRLWNQFLTECRQSLGLVNYVWRLEFQKNGNVHYHLATDSWLDYFQVKKMWNRILSKDGYVQAYSEKHSAMSLRDYINAYGKTGKVPFDVLARRYANGKAANWLTPPTVDAKSVVSGQAIAAYISKYFGKASKHGQVSNPLDNEQNAQGLRLWFCSRALSKLKTISDYLAHTYFCPKLLLESLKTSKSSFNKFCSVFFFRLNAQVGFVRQFLEQLFRDYAQKNGYIPSI